MYSLKSKCELYPHQIEALKWLDNLPNRHGMRGGVISYTMGLGKTLLGLIYAKLTADKTKAPTLIICPKTVMYEWFSNAAQFLKDVKILYFHPDFNSKCKNLSAKDILEYDIVITSYDSCLSGFRKIDSVDPSIKESTLITGTEGIMKDKIIEIKERYNTVLNHENRNNKSDKNYDLAYGYELIYTIYWGCVIMDESQRFANPTTATYKAAMSIYGRYKCCLTGTPIRNYCTDIWAQFRFLGYTRLITAIEWKRNYRSVCAVDNLVQTFTIIKKYEETGLKMPELELQRISLPFQYEKEDQIYVLTLKKAQAAYEEFIKKVLSFACVLALFCRLRQLCIAGYLILPESKRNTKKKVENGENDPSVLEGLTDDMSLWIKDKKLESGISSTKVTKIVDIIKTLPDTEKVLVFSMFTSCLDLIHEALTDFIPTKGICKLDGSVTGIERYRVLEDFKVNSTNSVMLIHYKVGSEGLNLPHANHVIFVEPWWTDAVHNQALARAWRNGQVKKVIVYQIIIKNTIEEKILTICNRKNELVKSILGDSAVTHANTKMDASTLRDILWSPRSTADYTSEKIEIIKLY